jgi:hypothetical protein
LIELGLELLHDVSTTTKFPEEVGEGDGRRIGRGNPESSMVSMIQN